MTLEPFRRSHLVDLRVQLAQQRYLAAFVDVPSGPAYTVAHDGRILCCGGAEIFPGEYSHLWSFVSIEAAAHMLALHRIVARFIGTLGRLVAATTPVTFEPGYRWLEILGFERSPKVLEHYGPLEETHYLYLRAS